MLHRTLLFLTVSCISIAAGADEGPREVQSRRHEIRFQLPAGWGSENLDDAGALLLMSPVQEAGWQTNVFLERAQDRRHGRSHDELIDTLVANLGRHKQDFALRAKRRLRHPSGLRGTELIYTHTVAGVSLTDKELVLRMGDEQLLVVTGSAVTSLWSKYEPEIDAVLTSIRPLDAPASASPRAGSPPR